jgi:hypothetical protein
MRAGLVSGLIVVLLAGLCAPVSAQWKWRDAKGQTQYSDLPPPQGVAESSILARPASAKARSAASAASSAEAASAAAAPLLLPAAKTVDPELEEKLRKEQQVKADKAKLEEQKVAAQKANSCSRARSQMRGLDEGFRIARINAQGEREVLDDKGRADETRRVKAIIASDCK